MIDSLFFSIVLGLRLKGAFDGQREFGNQFLQLGFGCVVR